MTHTPTLTSLRTAALVGGLTLLLPYPKFIVPGNGVATVHRLFAQLSRFVALIGTYLLPFLPDNAAHGSAT